MMTEQGAELRDCSRHGELEEVAALIAAGGFNINEKDERGGNTALHLACANGHPDVVAALCAAGALHLP
jgi:ankyrin repeat protein